ncbi:CoA transferase [Paralimibaculum aggregatum]|uniref:CoA transferase n=2 Tax=Paralimibaculum aggregatum TaxID=3036245 RepID=A0ABQ6LS36_9RHOB|nr:CoA transferase [Limibaculum sp. NKW23]
MALKGRRVVELSQFIAGPTAAQLLADFGAEVIKVEPPGGDATRRLPGTEHGSAYYRCFNTSKSNLTLEIGTEAGAKALDELLASADAVVCNIAPGTLARLGRDPERLMRDHPHLVVTLISGFGQDDARACMDTIAQCESGFAWMNGGLDGVPRVSTSWPVDYFSGLYAAYATAMALADPRRTEGVVIDVPMLEVASAVLLGPAAILAGEGAALDGPTGNRDRASAPSSIYACADGYAYVYAGLDNYWARLAPVVGGRAAPFGDRLAAPAEFDAAVEAWTRSRTRDEVLAEMARLGIPAGAVRDPVEAIAALRATRPDAVTSEGPEGARLPVFPARFSGQRIDRRPAPPLPADNADPGKEIR